MIKGPELTPTTPWPLRSMEPHELLQFMHLKSDKTGWYAPDNDKIIRYSVVASRRIYTVDGLCPNHYLRVRELGDKSNNPTIGTWLIEYQDIDWNAFNVAHRYDFIQDKRSWLRRMT